MILGAIVSVMCTVPFGMRTHKVFTAHLHTTAAEIHFKQAFSNKTQSQQLFTEVSNIIRTEVYFGPLCAKQRYVELWGITTVYNFPQVHGEQHKQNNGNKAYNLAFNIHIVQLVLHNNILERKTHFISMK